MLPLIPAPRVWKPLPGPLPATVEERIDPSLPKEGYRFDGHTLTGGGAAGLRYGQTSLRRLRSAGWKDNLFLEDSPRFRWRGLMLDSARHFQSVETILGLLERMADLKLNVFHWHLTDDQGWRLEIPALPLLTERSSVREDPEGSGSYSAEDVRRVVERATQLGIDVVPEIEMPAHATAAIHAYPELSCAGDPFPAEGPGLTRFHAATGKRIFCASKEETYRFLETVLEEVLRLFPGPVIHLGGDERPDGPWASCPRCRAQMEAEGLRDESALQHRLMSRVASWVQERGRRTMAWCGTTEHGVIPGQIQQDWFFGTIPEAVRLGAEVVNSHDRHVYLDYPNHVGRQKPGWMPILEWPKMLEFEPVPEGVPEEAVMGSEACVWTEHLEVAHLDAALSPRLEAFAERMWVPAGPVVEFGDRLKALGLPRKRPDERQPRLPFPVHFDSPWSWREGYGPEWALDPSWTRFAWTVDPPQAGDSLTVVFDSFRSFTSFEMVSGSDDAPEDQVLRATVEVRTAEGWKPLAEVGNRARLHPHGPFDAFRLTLVESTDRPLALRLFRPV